MIAERAVPGEVDWPQLSAPHMARYLAVAELAAGRRVLDAGSGAGYGASMLSAAGAMCVHGVDCDAEAVGAATTQFGSESVTFAVDDCQRLSSVSGRWDLICSLEVIEHLEEPEKFLHRAGQLLAPTGALVVSTPERASTPPFVNGKPRNPYHKFEWYRQEFLDMLRRHFGQVELRVQVESTALRSRREAVAALRAGLMVSNPLLTFVWRKWPLKRKVDRSWAKLAGLAVPSIADFPVVPSSVAAAYGLPRFNVAICRNPISGGGA